MTKHGKLNLLYRQAVNLGLGGKTPKARNVEYIIPYAMVTIGVKHSEHTITGTNRGSFQIVKNNKIVNTVDFLDAMAYVVRLFPE